MPPMSGFKLADLPDLSPNVPVALSEEQKE
jgi:hypothetical protein